MENVTSLPYIPYNVWNQDFEGQFTRYLNQIIQDKQNFPKIETTVSDTRINQFTQNILLKDLSSSQNIQELARQLTILFQQKFLKFKTIDKSYLQANFDKQENKLHLKFILKDKKRANLNIINTHNRVYKSQSKVKNQFLLSNILGFCEQFQIQNQINLLKIWDQNLDFQIHLPLFRQYLLNQNDDFYFQLKLGKNKLYHNFLLQRTMDFKSRFIFKEQSGVKTGELVISNKYTSNQFIDASKINIQDQQYHKQLSVNNQQISIKLKKKFKEQVLYDDIVIRHQLQSKIGINSSLSRDLFLKTKYQISSFFGSSVQLFGQEYTFKISNYLKLQNIFGSSENIMNTTGILGFKQIGNPFNKNKFFIEQNSFLKLTNFSFNDKLKPYININSYFVRHGNFKQSFKSSIGLGLSFNVQDHIINFQCNVLHNCDHKEDKLLTFQYHFNNI